MTISFGGLSSGLPVDDIISQLIALERKPIDLMKERISKLQLNNAQYKNVQDRASKLLQSIKTLTAQSVLDQDLFRKKAATSSDEAVAKATVQDTASIQTINLEVINLATQTKAESTSGVGTLASGTSLLTDIAQGSITDGNFTVFVNGVASTVTVDTSQDLDSVLTQIAGIAGINGASVVNGQIVLDYTNGTNVQLGANGDTSNFLNNTFLKTGTKTATSITSSIPLSTLQLDELVSAAAANFATPVTDGTFTIGKATFDTTGKTLGEIITEINNSSDAGVTASFNIAENQLELTALDSGSTLITLSNGTGNFLTAVGLISGGGDTTVSQTAGENAEFKINGTTLYSATNNVNSGISGLTGVTLELTGENAGSPISITIGRDTEELETQLDSFVNTFNTLISFIDEQMDAKSTNAKLVGDGGLRRLRNSLRTTVSDLVSGLAKYSTLSLVGISTGAVTAGGGQASPKLQFDKSKFNTAIADDPEQVRDLMIGTSGILTQLQSQLDLALYDDPGNTSDGIFYSHDRTIQSQIDSINDQIERSERRIDKREQLLRQQFSAMESAIAQAQSQGNALTGLIAQLSANSGN